MHEAITSVKSVDLSTDEEEVVEQPGCSYDRILPSACILVAFLIPIKLSLTYIALIPLILTWLWLHAKDLPPRVSTSTNRDVIEPLSFFILSVIVSSIVGIDPLRSASLFGSLIFFSLTLVVFAQYGELQKITSAVLAGQSLASLHSVIDAGFPGKLPFSLIGKVSESGQLALSVLLALGFLWGKSSEPQQIIPAPHRRWLVVCGALTTSALVALGFREGLRISHGGILTFVICGGLVALSTAFIVLRHNKEIRRYAILATIQIPLLLSALLVNLKRGPWLGVIVGTTVFFAVFAPRLVAIFLSLATLASITLDPISDRIAASYQHFTISGGRSTIWRIGTELIAQFPLGIGFHNSDILRSFAPEIPPELRHFHNNIIHILAESGWLSLAIFAWFIVTVLRRAFRKPRKPIHVSIGCAIIAWQVAGLVEYNVGDSEVLLMAWIIIGALLYDQSKQQSNTSDGLSSLGRSHHDRSPA